jgi:clathrin heavy chain
VTLESEKFVCVRETVGGQNQVAIIEIENVSAVRFPIQADSAIMNPTERIIAVKGSNRNSLLFFPLRFPSSFSSDLPKLNKHCKYTISGRRGG